MFLDIYKRLDFSPNLVLSKIYLKNGWNYCTEIHSNLKETMRVQTRYSISESIPAGTRRPWDVP